MEVMHAAYAQNGTRFPHVFFTTYMSQTIVEGTVYACEYCERKACTVRKQLYFTESFDGGIKVLFISMHWYACKIFCAQMSPLAYGARISKASETTHWQLVLNNTQNTHMYMKLVCITDHIFSVVQ